MGDNQGAVDEKGPGEMEVFPAFHAVPFSKMLTFFKSDTFKVAGEYSGPVPFPDSHIGNFEVGEVRPTAEGGNQKVKVKVRINPNGIFGVASASLVEKHEVEEEVPVEMEVDEKKEDGEKKEGAGGEEKMEGGEEKKEEAAKEGGEDKMETEAAKKEAFWHMASNVLNKPKPKVEPPPPPPTEPAKEEGMETEKGSESKASEEAPQQKQAEMDVD